MLSYDSIGRSLAYRVPDSSIYYMTKALEIAKEKEMWERVQKSYTNLAVVYQVAGSIDSALKMVHRAEQLFELVDDSVQYGPITMAKGNIQSSQGQHKEALKTYKRALQHYLETEQYERAADAAGNAALSYQFLGYFNLATEMVYGAMSYHELSGSEVENPRLWNTLGNLHVSQHNHQEALKAYKQTYKLASDQNNAQGLAISASNIASAFAKLGVADSAIKYNDIARDYATRINNVYTQHICNRTQALVHKLNGDYAAGWELLFEATQSDKDKIPPTLYADLLETMIMLQIKDEAAPLSIIGESLALYEEIGVEDLPIVNQREYHRLAGAFLEKSNDFKNALISFKLHRTLHDSIWNIEKSNRINELNIQFETLKKDAELDQLKREQLQSSIRIANQRNAILGIGGGSALFLLVTIAGFFLYRQRQRYRTLAESIASRDFERNRLARELHDGVANELYGLQMAINNGQFEQDAQLLEQQLRRIRDEVRHISHDLSMPDMRDAPLPEMARYLVNRWRHVGKNVNIEINPDTNEGWRLGSDKTLHLYRILQEGLTNALRYSREDREVGIQLSLKDRLLQLEITNHYIETLVGESTPGIGLKNLQERAELIGGRATVEIHEGRAQLLVKVLVGN